MAVPTYFGNASAIGSAAAGATPLLPASTATDDLLLLVIETANEPIAAPTDWTQVSASPQGTGTAASATATAVQIFWRRKPAAGYTDPVLPDAGDHILARIAVVRGVSNVGNPIHVAAGDTGASSTSAVIPGLTTTLAECLVVAVCSWATDSSSSQTSGTWTNASLGSIAERFAGGTTAGNGGGVALSTGTKAVAGAVSATTDTLIAASAQGRIALAVSSQPPVTVHERSASLSATGSITVAGQRTLMRSVSLSATGTISAAGEFWTTFERSVSLSATGSIATTGHSVLERSVSLSATGSISTSGEFWTTFDRSVALSATGTISTSGVVVSGVTTHERSVSLVATGTISVEGHRLLERSVSLAAIGAISVAGQRDVLRSVSLSATGTITTSRQVVFQRSVALTAVASISVRGVLEAQIVALVVTLNESGPTGLTTEGGSSATTQESSGVHALIE